MTIFVAMLALFSAPLEDGTLIFTEHGRRIVEIGTDATITHVAIVVTDKKGVIWVYEATPPKVRKVTLETYYQEIVEINKERTEEGKQHVRMWVMRPEIRITSVQRESLKDFLDSKLSKPYSILSFLTGRPSEGYHCGEFVSHALKRLGIVVIENPCTESPQTVIEKVARFYRQPIEVCVCGHSQAA